MAQADAHACLLGALGLRTAAVIGGSAGAPSSVQLCRDTIAVLLHGSRLSRKSLGNSLAAKQEHQFNHKNDDDDEFEHGRASLVELLDQEAVEFARGGQFLIDESLVIGHADLGRSEAVKARREHIAEKLDRIVDSFCERCYACTTRRQLEYANSQLLDFRHYDEFLTCELNASDRSE